MVIPFVILSKLNLSSFDSVTSFILSQVHEMQIESVLNSHLIRLLSEMSGTVQSKSRSVGLQKKGDT